MNRKLNSNWIKIELEIELKNELKIEWKIDPTV
jgi:hypothetical protein